MVSPIGADRVQYFVTGYIIILSKGQGAHRPTTLFSDFIIINIIIIISYLTADGPDLSNTGGGPLARRAWIGNIKIDLKCCPRQHHCSPAKCTFNSSSLALLLLIARAPNMMKLSQFHKKIDVINS